MPTALPASLAFGPLAAPFGPMATDAHAINTDLVNGDLVNGELVNGELVNGDPVNAGPTTAGPIAAGRIAADTLATGPDGLRALHHLVDAALHAASRGAEQRTGPVPTGRPTALDRAAASALGTVLPEVGVGASAALAPLARDFAAGSVDLADPATVAHLQAAPLAVAVAADVVAAAYNQSVDTWDSGPHAVAVERAVIAALASLAGLPADAGGVFTPGGTISNLMGLLLARDLIAPGGTGGPGGSAACGDGRLQPGRVNIPRQGVAALGRRPVVLCSELAHFSIARGAGFLGLGEDAVLAVPVDAVGRMRADAAEDLLAGLGAESLPVALVATAGTTDLGAIDPLPELARVAARHGLWFHVDAAYGGGALFSRRLAGLLAGIERADSITLDLHKLAWQPAAASVFLVRDRASFGPLNRQVAYLNPDDDEAAGYPSLLGSSLQTTRRADALRVAAAFRALGRRGLGAMVDRCHALAQHAAARIAREPRLALAGPATLTNVVFRYLPSGADPDRADQVNGELRRRLLREGTAVIGRTAVPDHAGVDRTHLKLTLLNPHTATAQVDSVLDAVLAAGAEAER